MDPRVGETLSGQDKPLAPQCNFPTVGLVKFYLKKTVPLDLYQSPVVDHGKVGDLP